MSFIRTLVNVSSYFNVVGITTDDTVYTDESGWGLDGGPTPGEGGGTFSDDGISGTVSTPYQIFVVGSANSANLIYCNSQNIPLSGSCSNLYLLGSSINSPVGWTSDFTINYTDESTDVISQGVSDWVDYTAYDRQTQVFSYNRRNHPDGSFDGGPAAIFVYTFPVDETKELSSLTLAPENEILIFALGLGIDDLTTDALGSGTGLSEVIGSGNNYTETGSGGELCGGTGLSEVILIGTGGCLCGGSGSVSEVYSEVGSSGAVGSSGEGIYSIPVFLTTEDSRDILTLFGDYLVTMVTYLDAISIHNVTGTGGALGSSSSVYAAVYHIDGSSGGLCEGTGAIHAHHNITGTGGSLGSGTGLSNVFGSGNNYHETGSGGDLCSGTGIIHANHNVTGIGGILASGSGVAHYHFYIVGLSGSLCGGSGSVSGTQHFIEIGSGGILIGGIGILGHVISPYTVFKNTCALKKVQLYYCNGAYIPVLTRCNQVIIDLLAKQYCNRR